MAYLSTDAIRKISRTQRDFLLKHVDGPHEMDERDRQVVKAKNAMLRAGLVQGVPRGDPRPRTTELSDAGRQAVCAILGEAADALLRAGLLEHSDPVAALRRLRTFRRGYDAAVE